MISVPGVGSGLDINSIVESLVAAEGDAKTTLLANKRADTESEISAFGGLKSVVSTFQSTSTILKNPSTYAASSAVSADPTVYSASTTGAVSAGVYGIEVREIAEAHKLLTRGYTDQDTIVGTGTMTISVGTSSFDITIDNNNNTLAGIRSAINDASDNTGVSATIANVDDGAGGTVAKLILSSKDTGTDNALTITVIDDDLDNTDSSGLSAFYYDTDDATTPEQLTEINAAIDAEIYIDGQKVLSASNVVSDAIEGVSLTLLKKDAGNVHDLTVETDTEEIKSKIELFVSNYNSVISYINGVTAYDAEAGSVGLLIGDATIRNLSNQIRTQINQTVTGINGPYTTLVDLGITSTSDGTLIIDDMSLDNALKTNLDGIEDLFSSTNGVASRLTTTLTQYTQTDGFIDSKTSGLNRTIDGIDDDLVDLQLSLSNLEERLLAQYSALDLIVSQLNSTGSFLTQQFEQIKNITSRSGSS